MATHIFIQARLGSTRLPGKALMKICGKSVFELIVERLRFVKGTHDIILVTGPKEKNLALVEEAKRLDMRYFCGSEENLLDRFYQASREFGSDIIIRITGDCPLIDAELIEKGLEVFKDGEYDLVGITRKRTYPHGLDFEVFKRSALATAWQDNLKKYRDKEKFDDTFIPPTKYMLEEEKFAKKDILSDKDLSSIRLTLDYSEDFAVIKEIVRALYKEGSYFGLSEILGFLKENPAVLKLNEKYIKEDYGIKVI